jgi:hypothetical protein
VIFHRSDHRLEAHGFIRYVRLPHPSRKSKRSSKRQAPVVTKRYARAKEINGLFAKLSNLD